MDFKAGGAFDRKDAAAGLNFDSSHGWPTPLRFMGGLIERVQILGTGFHRR
jgi:hypothetical protein